MSEDNVLINIIVEGVKKVLTELEERSSEALIALESAEYAVVLGALSGLETKIQHVSVRLTILYEVQQKQNQQKRRNT